MGDGDYRSDLVLWLGNQFQCELEIAVNLKGTSFQIYWPTIGESSPLVPDEKTGALPRGLETIMVVEDEVAVREMIERVLQAQGYRIVCAGSAEEAQELFRQSDQPIDLLLPDVGRVRVDLTFTPN